MSNSSPERVVTSSPESRERPLCVDLDGSLIRTDLLYEAVLLLLRNHFHLIVMLPLWLMQGKAHLKMQIAKRVTPDVTLLPYRIHLVEMLKTERARGRKLVLATASPYPYAKAIAEHLRFFDGIEATDDAVNLVGKTKADRLSALYGEKGFDYVGNSRADFSVWDKAGEAIVVGDDRAALSYCEKQDHARHVSSKQPSKPRWRVWLKAIRVHQWLKNSLIFVPAILTSQLVTLSNIPALILAFLAFSLCASSVYLFNDLLDIESDRKHRSKHARPIPSGLVSPAHAIVAAVLFIAVAFSISVLLPPIFSAVLLIYLVVTTTYSFLLKRMLLIDTLTLAGLFAIRVIAGSAAIAAPISTWLLAFCMFFFLSLAFVKRYVELDHQVEVKGRKDTGRGYHSEDAETISQGGLASGFAAVVVLALFIDTPQISENYTYPELIWLVCPLVLYLILRIWTLARRQEMNDDPVVFLMTDWRSQLMIALGAVVMLVAQMI
ncbi:4-hydroxybenzoate polyprenyltransferase [Cohaesibacter sp. ES.047]|uniref:UbiA family prenyltransferase n=1 Tax=Cohaesibacter sp. ES.047 TaxID=1798205 RepID=UPI000BB81792|nr:UbiA family prenyltransferase [Cohaesibacter sp. ES.047]SNY92632.1 4-hydroxybenzoate polyprenyltransferase [Cohaesibacter sp. ES.047]